MNGMNQIFKKEMARVFKDKKMVFSVFLLPVLIMVLIMSIVNGMVDNMMKDIEKHNPIVYVQNEPQSFQEFLKMGKFKYEIKEIQGEKDRSKAEKEILEGEADLIIEFPENLDEQLAAYKEGDKIPQIKTYYNPSEDFSSAAYEEISVGVLENYRQTLLSMRVGNLENIMVFTVNSDNEDMVIQDDEKAGGKVLGMMLPYFITILLFAGALGIGGDMIAGEKERGTMASLLVSPVKRSSIALGKVTALMAISGLSSLVYVAVMAICAPMMMDSMMGGGGNGLDLHLNPQQLLLMGVLLIAIAFFYSSIIALLSVFAKSTKEANSYVMPVYMVVIIVGLLTMFQSGTPETVKYWIPIYNNALVLQGILTQEISTGAYLITMVENLLLGALFTGGIIQAFKSEKIMSK
ncbi:MAG: ABC transporter permease [Lachnospiraceae bacterium]|nr:ABC transporter permease [Lachnospiraceae bacterium]MDD7379596.1 ABC transporter permease [Lachnospiraceae bacterium]MDY4617862.1 ABC transporter permease [Lachnospiraceae bacterium]